MNVWWICSFIVRDGKKTSVGCMFLVDLLCQNFGLIFPAVSTQFIICIPLS